ncbi:hypothetical protein, partial [Bacillus mycoides]|uniref:hypothetical protein n=1 Tax=Bacillus mycoides TaxID=1405 RepID=UPI003A7F6DCD
RLVEHKKSKGRENVLPFYDMEEDAFRRLFNTYTWLAMYNSPYLRTDNPVHKPTNEDIVEAMELLRTEGADLLVYAKKHPKGDLRTDLMKMAKKEIECAAYYIGLVQEDFFKDKELKTIQRLEEEL